MHTLISRANKPKWLCWSATACLLSVFLAAAPAMGQTAAGYSEYYIPGNEDNMGLVLCSHGVTNTGWQCPTGYHMHTVINVTAWSDSTSIYYDHWENGYNFDPTNPTTADETYTLNTGQHLSFESANIALPRTGNPPTTTCTNYRNGTLIGTSTTCYDGSDHIYVAGGVVTVTRVSWVEERGVGVQGTAWEIYPVKPQLTAYIVPFGETLNTGNWYGFQRVATLIQATQNNTTVTVDLDGDGTPDTLYDQSGTSLGTSVTLQAGQTFLLNDTGAGVTAGNLVAGAVIQGSSTLQVKYIAGRTDTNYCTRGFSAFPRGYWTTDYYAPLDQPTDTANGLTDYYLYNPNSSAITVNWESLSSSGSFSIPACTTSNRTQCTVSFRTAAGVNVPVDSGLYFKGSDVFWGVGSNDANGYAHEWGYSLLPSAFLYTQHFLGWAPDCYAAAANCATDMGAFLTPVQDNTTVFVDLNNDGVVEQTYTLNRLQSQFIDDPNDGDLSGAHIWATGPFTMAYGQNSNAGVTSSPALDLGYVSIPGTDFISLVLKVSKSVSPQVVPTASGSQATFTVRVNSEKYTVDGVTVTDTLPPNWSYVSATTTITKADGSTVTGTSANPTIAGQNLTWSSTQVGGNMSTNQQITITFTAQTTAVLAVGTLSENNVKAVGTRTVGGITQTFTATDFAYVVTGTVQIAKTSSVAAATPLFPGDTLTYTTTVTNPAGSQTLTGVSLYDPLPTGETYVASSGSVTCEVQQNVRDEFATQAYTNNGPNNTANWAGNWTETDIYGNGTTGATGGLVWITGGQLQFRDLSPNDVLDQFNTNGIYTENDGTSNWNGAWTETSDDNSATTGTIRVTGNHVRFRPGTAGRSVSRTATVTGTTSAAINFSLTDVSIVAGETVVAEYSVDGGAYVTIGTLDGGNGWSGSTLPLTIALTNNNTLTVRFRAPQAWTGTQEADLDNVEIDFGVPGTQIQRTANLTGALGPVLSFTYSSANLVAGDTLVVEASSNGTTFTTLATFTGGTPSVAPPYDLSSYVSANTTIRFRVTGGFNATNKTFSIGNADITYGVSSTFTSGSPPDFLLSATRCRIRPNNSLTLTFNATVNNPLPTGLTSITNTASTTSTQLLIPVSASVTNIVANPGLTSASVSGRVWLDANGNATIDVGETGLTNIEVTLKDQFGTPIAVTTTDSQGHYLFTNVAPGNGYYTQVTSGLPSGLSQTAPSGHTDNRSNAFNLSAGGSVTDQNLGYRSTAGTATFGDTVWSDFNGNGVQDLGEPGIVGVTVRLYTDTNGNGHIDGGETYITTTTGPGGTYLFTGVAAGQNYIVNVPSGQALLSGYSQTTPFTLGYLNAAANTAYLTADFGFRSTTTTYTITDRVWYDANGNGSVDGGETGIAGVSVDLLDNSGNVIGTTTTDASGNLTFSGVANGTYRLRVTDRDNKLGDYYGTTSYAQNALRSGIIVSGANVTNTSFGYNLSRAIGGIVFNDIDGNGAQNGSELGISSVTVLLYRDANGNGILEPGTDTLVGTLSTDASGHYLFTGLTSGTYWVSIDRTQTALSGFTTLTTGDDVPGVAGDQRLVTTLSNLNINYGYRAPISYSISGTLWNDLNDNGVDNSEPGLANVTIQLLQGGIVIATTSTDTNGNYSFPGLPAGSYTVRVTDSNGVLAGYNTTYEKTEGALAGSYNGQEAVTLGPSVSNVNFGYNKPKPTLVSISDFSARVEQGRVVVQWVTEFEIGTVGFHVERWNPILGVFERITPSMLPGLITSSQGGTYEYADPGARPDEDATYRLIEVEAWGTQRVHGPYTVRPTATAPTGIVSASLTASLVSVGGGQGHDDPGRGYRAVPHALRAKTTRMRQSVQGAATSGASAVNVLAATSSGAAQVKVRQDGLVSVSASDLAGVFNVSEATVGNWIGQGKIKLTNAGRRVAWAAAPGNVGVLFYGQAIDSLYTLDNVYRVKPVAGTKMRTLVGTPSAGQPAGVFTETLKFEQDKFAATVAATDPESDYWFWAGFIGDTPGWSSNTFTLEVPDVMGGGTLAVGFSGAAATDHPVEIWLNGQLLGDGDWSGLGAYVLSLPVDGSMLQSGTNSVEVRALGTSDNMFYLQSFKLTYERQTRAVKDSLTVQAANKGPVAVDGFSVPAISVLNITHPRVPRLLSGTKIVGTGSGYNVTFQARQGGRYLAVGGTAVVAQTAQAESGTNLKVRDRVDYAVITTASLADAAQALADYRTGTPLKARVVLVDDIYNNFNFGIANPHALGSFLRQAARNWGLRYAVLAGVGTLDYRDLLGYAEEQVPTLMTATPFGLYACDGCLADFNGNGVPDLVVSRIPAGTGADLQTYLAKLKMYEQGTTTLGAAGVLMLADADDPSAGDFPFDSDQVAELLPAAVGVEKDYLSEYDLAAARTLMLGRLKGDLGWMNYIGHGNIDRMSSGGLMTTADVGGLQSAGMLPVVSALTCAVNRFEIPGYASLGEELVLQAGGGAMAAWAATGLSLDDSAVQLDESLFKEVFQSKAPVLGDALRRSLQDNRGIPLFMLRIYNLLGDGALRLRH